MGGGPLERDVALVALAITRWLLRDHLDKNRALLGLLALLLIPLYDVKAEMLNANTVMIPFWAKRARADGKTRDGMSKTSAARMAGFGTNKASLSRTCPEMNDHATSHPFE
jgi:hypothetical protein